MKERPILFTPENAQKCHEGTKTQTRRIIKRPEWATDNDMLKLVAQRHATGIAYYVDGRPVMRLTCPYGVVGDRLWVRESWAKSLSLANDENHPGCILYRGAGDRSDKWKPSLHMPRWACRTVVELTDVRVERLHKITEDDAKAEGIDANTQHVAAFVVLWESINGKDSWSLNPWVWVLTMRKVENAR